MIEVQTQALGHDNIRRTSLEKFVSLLPSFLTLLLFFPVFLGFGLFICFLARCRSAFGSMGP